MLLLLFYILFVIEWRNTIEDVDFFSLLSALSCLTKMLST